jgi:transketolase
VNKVLGAPVDERDRRAIACIRGLCMDMPAAAGSGHSGTALALAPLVWLLYSQVMRHHPARPGWPQRDRLVLSNGHACVVLYAVLHLCGYDLSLDDLKQFRRPGSKTPGHPESWVTPGIDFSTGPLGLGLASAVGLALAERFRPGRNHFTYVLCSDGDLMEGVTAEASSLAGHQRLGKLIVFFDDNRVTIDGPASLSQSEDILARYRAYNWQVLEADSGEDWAGLLQCLKAAKTDQRPSLIRVPTVIGFPAPSLQGRCEAHSPHFPADEIRATKVLLGLDPEQSFQIPEGVYRDPGPKPDEIDSPIADRLADWRPPSFEGALSTRQASGRVLQSLLPHLPELVGGSADLAVSTQSYLEGGGEMSPAQPQGRNLRYGVRELAMASICNGLAQEGLVSYCATYFAFSDQMKPALRLAALARIRSIFVWTHDSLALGEDGPTHQPVEQLAGLRAMPNFLVIRPADARETLQAWKVALAHQGGPVGLVLSRQSLPLLPVSPQLDQGGYVVKDGPPEALTLLATGSEVHLCLQAAQLLEAEAVSVRVVSLPCRELFEQQSAEVRASVLGRGPRLAVEAASPLGWHRWAHGVMGLESFGASGTGEELMRSFGFQAETIRDRALQLLRPGA